MRYWYLVQDIASELIDQLRHDASLKRKVIAVSVVILSLLFIASRLGCATRTESIRRYRLRGTVKFNGQLVPSGTIAFTAVRNGQNYSGYAGIENGFFDTAVEGKGHVGGEQQLTVLAFENTASNNFEEDLSTAKRFEEIEWVEELPYSTAELNLLLPL